MLGTVYHKGLKLVYEKYVMMNAKHNTIKIVRMHILCQLGDSFSNVASWINNWNVYLGVRYISFIWHIIIIHFNPHDTFKVLSAYVIFKQTG